MVAYCCTTCCTCVSQVCAYFGDRQHVGQVSRCRLPSTTCEVRSRRTLSRGLPLRVTHSFLVASIGMCELSEDAQRTLFSRLHRFLRSLLNNMLFRISYRSSNSSKWRNNVQACRAVLLKGSVAHSLFYPRATIHPLWPRNLSLIT